MAGARQALVEEGVGCVRAVVLDASGALVEAHLEQQGARPGDCWDARLLRLENGRAVVALDGEEAVLDGPPPPGTALGALLRVELARTAIPGPHRLKPARARAIREAAGAVSGPVRSGPDLAARLRARGLRVAPAQATGGLPGWDEALAEARLNGPVAFDGGELWCANTEAGLVIDVDGHGAPEALALAAAPAVAALLGRQGVGGSVLIDFPSLAGRAARARLDEALNAALRAGLSTGFECTAINGFGLVQLVLPRLRPSLIDLACGAPVELAGLEALRALARAPLGPGPALLSAAPALIRWLEARPALLAEASRAGGRATGLRAEPGLGLWSFHVHCAPTA